MAWTLHGGHLLVHVYNHACECFRFAWYVSGGKSENRTADAQFVGCQRPAAEISIAVGQRAEPVGGFESTCQTQTSWVNVSYVTSTRNLDEPLRWVQRHSTPRQLRQHHEVLFRCFPALCILRSGICDMKYFRRIPWYAAVHLAHRLASIGFDRRHHRCAGQNRCTSTWNALIDYRDALLRCRCRFTAPCMATTSPYMAITWRAISPLLHKWPLLAVNGHILHQIMVIYWQVMGT